MKFGVKKNLAILISCLLPVVFGGIAFLLYKQNPIFIFGGMILAIPISFILCTTLITHPILDALLGKGNIAFAIAETGQWIPFIVRPKGGYLEGIINGLRIEGIMDRGLLNFMGKPGKGTVMASPDKEKMIFELDIENYNRSRHQTDEIGFFLYSLKLRQFITKEMIATLENNTFSKHMITYTAYKVRELTSILRDFSRVYVDLYKENKPFWEQPWFKWVVIGLIIILAAYFLLPYATKALAPVAASAGKALDAPATVLRK